ncbi:response regulator transcription factor [Prolixibacteraceae bacterium JC049]|nr:response regulator transcription factor [Prolixibacteraceae bacterium JC049]
MKCIIVEDEPFAREILEDYISEVVDLHLQNAFADAASAREYIRNNTVDLILLDINMPEVSGITFLKSLPNPPKVIFTTAYPEYAVEGFELNAVDYLLKPFSFDRFKTAVDKVREQLGTQEKNQNQWLTINIDKKLYRLVIDDILYLEGCGDYVKIHQTDDSYLVHDTMKNLLEKLPSDFFRLHRSFIVNMNKIEFVEGNTVQIAGEKIPIGISYKNELLERIG